MKNIIFLIFCVVLLTSCGTPPSEPIRNSSQFKVTEITKFSDSTSMYSISCYRGGVAALRVEQYNGFATVGDVIILTNLSRKSEIPVAPVKKDTIVLPVNTIKK